MSLTTVTHFGPLGPPPEDHFMSKSFVLLKEFDGFSYKHQFYLRNLILFGLGWPLGPWRPFLDLSGRPRSTWVANEEELAPNEYQTIKRGLLRETDKEMFKS